MDKAIARNSTWNQKKILKLVVVLLPLLLVSIQWLSYERLTEELIYDVPRTLSIPVFEANWLYLALHIFSIVPVFALSFDKRVHYHTAWKNLFPAISIVAAIFIVWDVIFTEMNVWNFNENYFLGVRFLSLPIEEWLFFFTIPFASIFIYKCLNYYVPKDWFAPYERIITITLIIGFTVAALIFWNKIYTSTTFLLTAGFLLYHLLFLPAKQRSRFYLAFLVILIPFTLVDGVLTGGYTNAPIVLYNPLEFLNFRVFSIPFEDYVYGFLMLLSMISIAEYWDTKRQFAAREEDKLN